MAIAASPVVCAAQSALAGIVRDSASKRPLAEVEVLLPDLSLRAVTDAGGKFLLEDISGGRYRVIVRKLGFDSTSALIAFSGADDVHRDFALAQLGQPLPVVPIRESSGVEANAKLSDFEERRRGGIGHFLTPADLEKEQEKRLSDVIQKLPGVLIVHGRAGRDGASGNAAFVASSRGAATIENGGGFGLGCGVAIWLDGIAVYRGNDKVSAQKSAFGQLVAVPGQLSEPKFDINQINTKNIAAIEFYAGPAQIPARFNLTQGTCGALVIWTK